MSRDELVITADTIVWSEGQVLGKPHSEAEACRMLGMLSGRTHEVITGVTLMTASEKRTFAVVSEVTFDNLSEEEIRYYVDRYRPMDKAGAYGITGMDWVCGRIILARVLFQCDGTSGATLV